MNQQIKTSFGVIIILIVAVTVGVFVWKAEKVNDLDEGQLATQDTVSKLAEKPKRYCTQEAKLCSDGSYVSRTGPNCEFTLCPDNISDWQTYRNEKYGFEVEIPNTWPKFNVRERNVDEAAVAGGVKLVEFGFLTNSTKWPTENGLAYIWGLLVLTPEQYNKYSDPRDGSKPEIFKQNKDNIFSIKNGNGGAPDDLENQKSSVVFSTFKFTN